MLSNDTYNELGQLYHKDLHGQNDPGSGIPSTVTLGSADAITSGNLMVKAGQSIDITPGFSVTGGATFSAGIAGYLQTITYAYNERGWLRTAGTSSSLFNMELKYDGAAAGKQYNGNIAEMDYTGTHSGSKVFTYGYDKLNRLLSATSTGNTLDETLTYDVMGNIQSLTRGGQSYSALSYAYAANQLTGVTGSGFTSRTYAYDGNGNATSDGGSKTINYNLLNLPQSVTQSSATLATYTYDATGNKLRNVSTAAGVNDGTWDHVNGIVYHNGAVDLVNTEEGRAERKSDGSYNYEYDLKDHLGNNRVSMDSYNGAARVIQEDEYYSFGLRKTGGYDLSNNNRYLYNGKEFQTDLANQYDYGARFYDPLIARWASVDPLAEKSFSIIPFRYAFNNPVRVVDPNGAYEVDGHFWTVYLMLTMMGNKDAFNISNWTEWPDQTMYPSGDAASDNNSWLQPLSQQRIHALTGGFSNLERNSSYGDAVTASTSSELGIALHRLGDSYAHSMFGNEGRMYGGAFFSTGHAGHTGAEDPDAISNRPWLYRMYADRLAGALKERFGYKGGLDMFTFDYVAGSGGNTAQNSAIFETEISIRQGLGSFSVDGNQVDAVNSYIKSSNGHFGRSVQAKSVYTDVDVYNRDADGNWVKTKSEKRTFVTIQ